MNFVILSISAIPCILPAISYINTELEIDRCLHKILAVLARSCNLLKQVQHMYTLKVLGRV